MHIIEWDMWVEALWYCDVAAIALALGLLTRNTILITSVSVTAIPAQALWITDLILELTGGGAGRTAYMFEGMMQWNMLVFPVLLHSTIIPLALLGVWRHGFNRSSLWFTMGFFVLFLMTVTFFVTETSNRINCVLYPCDLDYFRDFALIASSSQHTTWIYFIKFIAFWSTLAVLSHMFFTKIWGCIQPINQDVR